MSQLNFFGRIVRNALAAFLLATACVVIVELLVFASSNMVRSPLEAMDDEVVDLSYHIRSVNLDHSLVKPEDVVIVDIDDYSIAQLGRSQSWPRSYDAKSLIISHPEIRRQLQSITYIPKVIVLVRHILEKWRPLV